jgi:type IV secretion system protein VirB4
MFSANSNKSNESDTLSKKNFKQISSEIIPIACHIDECTLITKNGELIQTIVIEYNDHSHKLTNTLQETLSSLLSEIGFDVSFWIQTIKVNNVENIDKIPNDQFSNVLLRKIDNYWRNEESRLSNYKVNSYIHFVIKGNDLKIKH